MLLRGFQHIKHYKIIIKDDLVSYHIRQRNKKSYSPYYNLYGEEDQILLILNSNVGIFSSFSPNS